MKSNWLSFCRRQGMRVPCRAAFLLVCGVLTGCGTKSPPVTAPMPVVEEPNATLSDAISLENVEVEIVGKGSAAQIVIRGLPDKVLASAGGDAAKLIKITTGTDDSDAAELPAMLGEFQQADGEIQFVPEFPLRPGARYAVRIQAGDTATVNVVEMPAATRDPTTRVVAVYPSTDVVPENLLKFYFHFSAPMSRGESYKHIQLIDQSGEPVDLPFLEIAEELWDSRQQRLTVLFDPGRIKRELLPRELLGPALHAGRRYTLVVQHTWPDATGAPLVEDFRKSFRVGPPDEVSPDVRTWKLTPPHAETKDSLVVVSPEPLDHALFERLLVVLGPDGKAVNGKVAISDSETRWSFAPDAPWVAGDYKLTVGTVLEDRAGNSIARTFEVDLVEKIEEKIEPKTVELPFVVEP